MSCTNKRLVYVAFLCVGFCLVLQSEGQKIVRIPAPLVLIFREIAKKCEKQTGVPASYLVKILDKSLPDELSSLKFFYCGASSAGLVDKDGRFVIEKMTALQVLNGTLDEYVNTIKECNKIKREDNLHTLDAISDCIYNVYHFVPIAPK